MNVRITVTPMLGPPHVQEWNEKIALGVALVAGLSFEHAGNIVHSIEIDNGAGDVWTWRWRPTTAQLLVAMAGLRP